MGDTFVRGNIEASRTSGGNITIDTTHTVGGLIRSWGKRPHIEIENADLDDAIAALQALRGDSAPVAAPSAAAPPPGDACARCGHHRVFHQIGTGNGVPRGQRFCDDRHAPPCSCDGFTPILAAPFTAVAAGFAMQGRWRVYFNKHGRADLPWCIAPADGGWELAVPLVLITTEAETVYQPKAVPDDEDGRPSAWLAVEGRLVVAAGAGRATIAATTEPEVQHPMTMTTDIDPAFADRCVSTAAGLRQLADVGGPDTDLDDLNLAKILTSTLLADPEALLAVALTIVQQRAAGTHEATVTGIMEGPIRIEMELTAAGVAARAIEPRVGGARVWATAFLPIPTAPPPPPIDDLSTLRRGETRLVGGKMWARCPDCGVVGLLEGAGSWHESDPVTESGPLTRQR